MQTYLNSNTEAYESFMDYVKQIIQQANSFGSRSSVLSILAWILGSLLCATTLAGIFKADKLILIGLFVLVVLMIIAILVAFFFCLFTDRTDILRSEKFNIEKLALEKQSSSDNLIDVHSTPIGHSKNMDLIEPVQEDQQ